MDNPPKNLPKLAKIDLGTVAKLLLFLTIYSTLSRCDPYFTPICLLPGAEQGPSGEKAFQGGQGSFQCIVQYVSNLRNRRRN
jgi:hypothetical protein